MVVRKRVKEMPGAAQSIRGRLTQLKLIPKRWLSAKFGSMSMRVDLEFCVIVRPKGHLYDGSQRNPYDSCGK